MENFACKTTNSRTHLPIELKDISRRRLTQPRTSENGHIRCRLGSGLSSKSAMFINSDTSLLFTCAMNNQISAGHVTARRIFVVVLTNYVIN